MNPTLIETLAQTLVAVRHPRVFTSGPRRWKT